MLELETLRIIWWVLLGVLLMGFAIMDGFDFGAAAMLPLIARSDTERRIVLNSFGPYWEGNQVWIILGAGAIFAAWPYVYSVAFSGFYLLILLLLLTMGIFRAVSFKYRNKLPNPKWRAFWDKIIFLGGTIPSIIFGVLIGNTLQGIPFYFDETLRLFYTGNFFQLFGPFPLMCGLVSLAMLVMHGNNYLIIKVEGRMRDRAIVSARAMAILLIFLFAVCGVWTATDVKGYQITSQIVTDGFSNPLHKMVRNEIGGWLLNYWHYPLTILAPVLGFLGAFGVLLTAGRGTGKMTFIFSSLSIMGIIATVGVSMFPFIIPSSSNPISSLLVWDASSTQLTLFLMLIATLIFMPLILMYTSWVFYVLRGKVSAKEVEESNQVY